jgi:hypothetical protein
LEVDKLEHLEIFFFIFWEDPKKFVKVLDIGGCFDFSEVFPVFLYFLYLFWVLFGCSMVMEGLLKHSGLGGSHELFGDVEVGGCGIFVLVGSLFAVGWELDFLHEVAHLFDLFLELGCFFFGLDLESLDLVMSFISLLVGVVGTLDDVGHFLPSFM